MGGLGLPKTGGRQNGSKNKHMAAVTAQRAQMIAKAFNAGVSSLEVMLAGMRRAYGRAEVLAGRLEQMIADGHPEDQQWANMLMDLWNVTDRAHRAEPMVVPRCWPDG
jgi:hypothetical protein